MKRLVSLFALNFLLFFSCDGISETNLKPLKIVSDEWCPYVCTDTTSPGLFPEVAQLVYGPAGYKVDLKFINYARSIEDTRSGTYDLIVGCAKEDAPDFKFPQEALATSVFEYFTLARSTWKYQGNTSIKNKKIGIINGYVYDTETMDLIKKEHKSFIEVSGDRGLSSLIKMLEAGRIDALIESPNVFHYYLLSNKLSESDFRSGGLPKQNPQKITACFSPKSPNSDALIKIWNAGLTDLKSNGKLKALYKKYGFH